MVYVEHKFINRGAKLVSMVRPDPKLSSLLEGVFPSRNFRYLDLFFACVLSVTFMLFVPITEWPDGWEHISRKQEGQTFYPFDIFLTLEELSSPTLNNTYSIFADQYMYRPTVDYFLINLQRLPIVLGLILGMYLLVRITKGRLLFFCPPLIYSLISPSQEALAITVILIALVLSCKSKLNAILLAVLSVLIDRSMVPSATFLCLYIVASPFRAVVTSRSFTLLAGGFILVVTSFLSPLDLLAWIDSDINQFLNITVWDVIAAAEVGQNKFLALAASTMGLYGWLSIRPFPFWVYYPVIALLFAVGFAISKPYVQSIFISLFLVSCLMLWLMPSLGQARYYPFQTIAFWSLVISGAQAIRINLIAFYCFIILATVTGCLIAFSNAI